MFIIMTFYFSYDIPFYCMVVLYLSYVHTRLSLVWIWYIHNIVWSYYIYRMCILYRCSARSILVWSYDNFVWHTIFSYGHTILSSYFGLLLICIFRMVILYIVNIVWCYTIGFVWHTILLYGHTIFIVCPYYRIDCKYDSLGRYVYDMYRMYAYYIYRMFIPYIERLLPLLSYGHTIL